MISKWPVYDKDTIRYATQILEDGRVNRWTGGQNQIFEQKFSRYIRNKYSVAVANGSNALHCAYKSLGLSEGDEVITTPRTFIATASELVYLGAKPVFADVDMNSGNITAESIESKITPKTKAISVVHLGGFPADMRSICKLADAYGLSVGEDCAQAHGAKIGGRHVGTFADIATWSFCQDKIISTGGEGGMISTNDYSLYKKTWALKDHGKDFDECQLSSDVKSSVSYRWLHKEIGTNFRMTEIQAAIGIKQLDKLESWVKIRAKNAAIVSSTIKDIPLVRLVRCPDSVRHAWYKYYFYVDPKELSYSWSRDRIIQSIRELGYPAFSGSCGEVYLEKALIEFRPDNRLKCAQQLSEDSICLLVDPSISSAIAEEYALAVRKVLSMAQRK